VFPPSLFCDQIEGEPSAIGPTWLGITIGESTLTDLENLLAVLSNNYWIGYEVDSVNILLDDRELAADSPGRVDFCLYGDRIYVLGFYYGHSVHPNLFDFLAEYGEPDAVTWSYNPDATRVVFWFEEGIAAEVVILPDDPDYDPVYGRITHLTLFPYQKVEGYENRWPYNRTHNFNLYLPSYEEGMYVEDSIYGPENPFNFEALMATITPVPLATPGD
jgi:hypothetical protein